MIDTKDLREKITIKGLDVVADTDILAALDRLEAAENENAKLRIALAEKVTSEATLRDLNFGNGFIKATFEGGAVQLMVDALADQFVESGASNYIEMQFHSEATGPLLFTLQRVDGKTPHQLRAEAEQERDALRAAVRHEADCVEAAKAEIKALRSELVDLRSSMAFRTSLFGRTDAERDALRAEVQTWQEQAKAYWSKITEMEQQEPVFWWRQCSDETYEGPIHNNSIERVRKQSGAWSPLYALPGAQNVPDFADAYQGAMEEAAIWKKRALEAEDLNRKFIAEINGPTHMGEPAQPATSIPEGWEKDLFYIQHAMAMNNWNWDSDASNDMKRAAYATVVKLLTAVQEAK